MNKYTTYTHMVIHKISVIHAHQMYNLYIFKNTQLIQGGP